MDTFYNPYNKVKITKDDSVSTVLPNIRCFMYSNFASSKDVQLNCSGAAAFNINLLETKNILSYILLVNNTTFEIIPNSKAASILYWEST